MNFDSQDRPRRSKPPVLSSQEVQQRRFVRRSVPPGRAALPASSGNDTKHYLFSKMIQGFPEGRGESAQHRVSTRPQKTPPD